MRISTSRPLLALLSIAAISGCGGPAASGGPQPSAPAATAAGAPASSGAPTSPGPTTAGGGSSGSGLQALIPDRLCDENVSRYSWTGEAIRGQAEDVMLDLADEIGTPIANVQLAAGLAFRPGCMVLVYRYPGADAARIRAAVEANQEALRGGKPGTLAGHDVLVGDREDSFSAQYFTQDLLIQVDTRTEAETTEVLEQLP
jgi:hypothetical protein